MVSTLQLSNSPTPCETHSRHYREWTSDGEVTICGSSDPWSKAPHTCMIYHAHAPPAGVKPSTENQLQYMSYFNPTKPFQQCRCTLSCTFFNPSLPWTISVTIARLACTRYLVLHDPFFCLNFYPVALDRRMTFARLQGAIRNLCIQPLSSSLLLIPCQSGAEDKYVLVGFDGDSREVQ